MKTIQWFPGHMTKAMRMMKESAALCDGAIYVLDARCPASSFNKKLKEVFGSKPVLYVLNKADLAENTAEYLSIIRSKGCTAVSLDATRSGGKKPLLAACEKVVAAKRARAEARGYTRTFRFMVLGVPNTGKSTVINLLSGQKRAITGDKAGVTRGKQWIRLGGFELLDTPGTMPPAFDDQRLARRLAYVGSVNDDILDMEELAPALLEELSAKYPQRLAERYGIEEGLSGAEMLECVCRRRGLIVRGGECDTERACRAVIDDLRKGRLGAIALDDADDVRSAQY